MELMSPAGSFEALMAAIKGGCDSVYFGIEQLNMRARSSVNFSTDDLQRIVRIARHHQIRTYLTLNTILYDHDITLMKTILDQAQEAGIDAVIASDHAVMQEALTRKLPVHISTQANVSNVETISFYAHFADVVVLARELSLKQVAHIASEIKRRDIKGPSGKLIRLELFGHGALCMAISGKCYLSLHSHYASANRGACVQNCRHSYIVTDKEDGNELEVDHEYIMSAKDLCTIDFLDQIADAGVEVLKLEGRGRSADYVYTVTRCYREAIDAIQQQTYTQEKARQWKTQLATVFNRGFWDGYYLGRTMGEWSNEQGSKADTRKIYIGKGLKYYSKQGIGEFICETHSLQEGDQLLITGPTTGVLHMQAEGLHTQGQPATRAAKGDVFTLAVSRKIRPSDKVYKLVTEPA